MMEGRDVFVMRGPISPLFMAIGWQKKEFPLDTFCLNRGRDSVLALDENNYFGLCTKKFERYYKKEITRDQLIREYKTLEAEIQAVYDKTASLLLHDLSESDLVVLMQDIVRVFLDLAERTVYVEVLDQDKILNVIGKDKKSLLEEIWENATHPTFVSFEGRWLKQTINIAAADKKDLIARARFIFTDYVWTKKDADIKKALDNVRAHITEKKKEYERLEKAANKRKCDYEEWRSGLDSDAQYIVDYIQWVMFYRDIRKDMIAQLLASLSLMSAEFFRRAGIDEKYAPATLMYEYLKGVEYLKSIRGNIEKRSNGWISVCYVNDTYETELCDFNRASEEVNQLIVKREINVDTVKGQIAYKGRVTGVARVVLDPHDDKGFKKGDILVTSMTRPEFVHIMKQAGAVITDEGGITCHAAIISRELHIPCITGTKIATRVLKDGDMVEVDAGKGIVKKIK